MYGKIVIVTGAGRGIGRAMALAGEGAAVVIADIDAEAGTDAGRQIVAAGGRAESLRADVAVEEDVQAVVGFAQERFGGLDILVNNVGIAPSPYFPEAAPEHWGRTLDVNLRGMMLAIQGSIPAMRQRGGGAVVNISSMAGPGCRSYHAVEYAVSKAAVVRLTSALGFLHEREKIRVNCICPGWVGTPSILQYLAVADPEELAALDYPPPAVLIRARPDRWPGKNLCPRRVAGWVGGHLARWRVVAAYTFGTALLKPGLLYEIG
jgi:NAD(P)-dependent dehydrogenase (short-subunit alcohol dehydrogenase family)